MACPHCDSEAVRRDYAPPRPFAYLLGGGALLFAQVFAADRVADWGEARRSALLLATLAALFLGLYESATHGNRYCAACGAKFRQPRRAPEGFNRAAFLEEHAPAPADGRGRHGRGARRPSDEPPPDTPIPPLLKVLRFKNPAMRAEAAETLRKITGEHFGEDAGAWEAWYARRGAEDTPDPPARA